MILETWIDALGGDLIEFKVSRFDLCSDFLISGGLKESTLKESRVSKSSTITIHEDNKKLETFYVGSPKSSIRLRIYDKHAEMEHSGLKNWLLPIWQLESSESVWRVEYQVRRQAAKEMGINSPLDLFIKQDDVWAYLTEKWCSFRVPSEDSNISRREPLEFWKSVQASSTNIGASERINRRYKPMPVSVDWYISHLSGCLKGYAARMGIKRLDLALHAFIAESQRYWKDKNFEEECKIHSIKIGLNPESELGSANNRKGIAG